MKKLYLSLILILCFSLPCFAVNCEKKPCHKKCIDFQSDNVKLNCYCQNRKNIYYSLGRRSGVPEYDERCDGSIENYRIRYCEAKREYDNRHIDNALGLYSYGASPYFPDYDANCDGSYEDFVQSRQELVEQQRQIQQENARIREQRNPQYIYHDVNIQGTMQLETPNYTPQLMPFSTIKPSYSPILY